MELKNGITETDMAIAINKDNGESKQKDELKHIKYLNIPSIKDR